MADKVLFYVTHILYKKKSLNDFLLQGSSHLSGDMKFHVFSKLFPRKNYEIPG